MNKKILAIAALALVATSGLASAQTARQVRGDRETRIVSPFNSNAAIHNGSDRSAYVGPNGYRWHPGDNSNDAWLQYDRQAGS